MSAHGPSVSSATASCLATIAAGLSRGQHNHWYKSRAPKGVRVLLRSQYSEPFPCQALCPKEPAASDDVDWRISRFAKAAAGKSMWLRDEKCSKCRPSCKRRSSKSS